MGNTCISTKHMKSSMVHTNFINTLSFSAQNHEQKTKESKTDTHVKTPDGSFIS